jgi:predicted phosphodiesterase
MKITYCSDLHLNLGDFSLLESPEADVLILAGDIFIANELLYLDDKNNNITAWIMDRLDRYVNFINQCCSLYKNVILILGNHEHYDGTFNNTAQIITDTFNHLKNLHFLDNSSIMIQDVLFIGGTLWTDMNQQNLETIEIMTEKINDYHNIFFDNGVFLRNFEVEDGIQEHNKTLNFIQESVKTHNKVIVVTHHAPSKRSEHPRYKKKNLLNFAYHSDLDDFIETNSQIKYWFHGHTHKKQDYKIGNTRILCNPRGYLGVETIAMKFEWSVVDV